MSDRTPPPGIEEVYGNLSAPGASLGLAAVDRKPPPGADELFGSIAPPKPAPAADERRGLLATVADAARGLLAREAPAAPEGSNVGNFRVPASVPTQARPAGELLTQPNPEAQQTETPAPLSREMAGRLKATLAAMKPEDRALAERIPGWRGVAAQVLNRQIAAESQGAQRLEVPGASLESRTAYGVDQGMDAQTATSKAGAELAAGLPGGPTAQLTAGRPSVLTPEEEAAARADGQGMQKRSTAARGFYGAQEGLAQGAAGVIAAALQAAGDKEGAAIYEKVGKAASVRAESANELKALQAKAAESGITPSGPLTGAANYVEGMSTGAANSIGQMIPGIAVGLATGSGPAALAVMALPVFGQSYVEKRDAGGAPGASAAYAGLMAGFEVLGERYGVLPAALNAFKAKAKDVPLEELPKFLERGIVAMEKRGLLNKTAAGLARTQAGEQFGEQLTSAGQYLLDGTALGLDKPVSVTGFLTNARDTAVQTLIATGVMQAGGVAAKKLIGAEGAQAAPAAAPAPAAPLAPVDLASTKLSGAEVPVSETGQEKPQAAPAAVEAVANIEKLLGTPLDADAHEAATSPLNDRPEPTQAQKDAGNYKVGHVRVQGLDVSIENPRGSVRRGTSPDGTAWENTLAHHYGYLKGTKAIDGDQVDVFIGPNPESARAYVVDQVDQNGKFDEPKALIGFDSIEDAKAGYLANYAPGWTGMGAITELPIDAFKSWAKDGTKRKPLGDINGAKPDAGGPAGLADRPADGGGDQPAGSVGPVGEPPAAGGPDGVPVAPEGTAPSGEPAVPVGGGSGADAALSREAVGQQFTALAEEFAASGRATGRTFQRVLAGYADNIADGSIKDAELPALAEKLAQYRRMLGEPETTPPAPPPVEPEVDTPTERAAGDVLQLDGKAWTITKASSRAITIKNEAGKVRTIAAGSPTWAKIDDQNAPNAAPAAEAVAPAVEAAAPASGDAGTTGAYPSTRPAIAQAARVTKPRKQQSAVRGSPALGAISARLGGIDPSLLADLSSKVERSRVSKLGKKSAYTTWDNPPHAGKGPLFRAGGSKDLSLIAQMLEEEGFIPAGTYEADPVGAGQQAAEIIRAELRQGGSTLRAGSADDVETEMRRRMEAAMDRFEEHGISPEAVVESGYLDTTEAAQAAWDAAIEALADAESDVVDAFLQSVAEVEAQEERDAIQADSEADAEAGESRGDAARAPEGGARPRRRRPEETAGGTPATAEGLTSPTPESLAADDRRAKDAAAADAREQKRLADKAKADAERGEFTLTGSDRPADVAAAAGQGDLLDAAEQRPASQKIDDVGEKIGGARKDIAESTGARTRRSSEEDARPAWARRFKVSQIVRAGGQINAPRDEGRWVISDSRSLDWRKQPRQVGRDTFATKEEAEAYIPIAAVSLKHRPVLTSGGKYEIWRDITDRKRVKVVEQTFETRDDATAYMAANAEKIIEANTTFGEADIPLPPDRARTGPERRTGDVKGEDFKRMFGFRGVEFGNWNNQDERQGLMNDAWDGLLDLADVLGVPPKALGLNGDLALAFGARGHGLNSARAHYERDRAVINLTKENGAGSLAHEWFHGLDHYFGRQDGKASATWAVQSDGTRTLKTGDREDDYVSHGFRRNLSGVRPEVREAYEALLQSMFKKAEAYVEDTAKADQFSGRAREELAKQLDQLRAELSAKKDPSYYKRNNKPATAEQLAEFDTIAKAMVEGHATAIATEWRSIQRSKAAIANRWTNDSLERLSAIYKEVRGRSGFDSTNREGLFDRLRGYMERYSQRLKMLAEAQTGAEKQRMVPTEFAMNAKELDQGRGTDYWTTPHEMAARAFQGYVEDKIAERGGVSRFLNYAPENVGIPTPWGFKRPFPAGAERKAINAAFDRFVGALQTREDDAGNVALFQRTAPSFSESLDKVLDGTLPESAALKVSDSLPVLELLGMRRLPLATTGDRLTKMHFDHGLTRSQLKRLPELLASPVAVFESDTQPGSLVAVLDLVKNGAPVVAAIKPSANLKRVEVNLLASAYPKDRAEQLGRWVDAGLLRYVDKRKTRGEATIGGVQFPWMVQLQRGSRGTVLGPQDIDKAAFSRKAGARGADPVRGAAQSYVDQITKDWANAPKVTVIDSMADAPEAVRRANESQMQQGADGEPSAFTYRGEVFIVAGQITSMESLAESLFHEALGHLGLRGLFGADLHKVLRQIAASMPDAVKAKAIKYGLAEVDKKGNFVRFKSEADRMLAAEEVLAEIAETRPSSTWVRKAIVAIREWLRKHIPALADLKWSDADIIERVIIPARRFIEEGRSREALAGEPAIAFQRVEGEPDAVFYSDLAGRIADSAMNAGAAGAWKQLLKGMTTSGKIKADEVAWSGLEEWLDLQPGKIGKQQIVDYLAANGVRVTETVLNEAGASFETMSRAEMAEAYERIVGYDPVEDDPDITDEDLRQQLREFANEAAASDGIGEDGRQPAQYGKYTLPGGKNYREVLLTLPVDPRVSRFHELDVLQAGGRMTLAEREEHAALLDAGMTDTKSGNYRSSHWKQPNILAHIRVNDRTDVDGKRVLFVEEIQSDWAQEGKKAGFVGIPAAPFVQKTDAWVALAIKRVVKMAADGGYDRVAFVNGEQAADRFDLSKQVRGIEWTGSARDGDRVVTISPLAGNDIEFRVLPEGTTTSMSGGTSGNEFTGKRLDEVVGKDVAGKIMAERSGNLSGGGLSVGGEGMKAFYDKIVPSVAKDVLRKLGGSLGSVELPNPNGQGRTTVIGGKTVTIENEAPLTQPGFDITSAMLDKVGGGVPLFQRTSAAPARSAWRDATNRVQFAPGQWLYDAIGAAARPLLIKTGMKAASPELRRQIRAMRLEVQKAQETAVAVARETQKLTEDERLMVSDIIEKELAAGTIPPAHAVRLAALMNQTMGTQTGDLVRLGMLTQETAQRWDGAYLPRFYESKLRKQVGDAWADALRRILGRTSAMKGIKGKHLKGRGLFETIAASDLPSYEALGWEVRDPDYTPGSDDQVQVWRDYTRAERDDMGEIRDAGFRFVMGYMQTQRDIALGKMFEGMAGDSAISSRLPKQGWVQVPNTTVEGTGAKRYGKLGGRYVPEEVLSHLSQIEESQSAAWQMYRKAMSIWKEGKTVLNPVSHVNNILSNLTMAHFAGVGYHRADKYVAAIRDFATKSPTIIEAKDAGLFLGTLSDAELMNTLPKELQDLAMQAESKTQRGAKFVYNAMTWFLRKPMGAAYQAEDIFFRYLIYKDARRRGVEPNEAVEYAQKFIFTYDDLPRGARFVRDFGIPFFAYTYKAVPALLHTALTHPVRFAAPAAVLWAANAMAYAIGAGDDDDSWDEILQRYLTDPEFRAKAREAEQLERELLPEWMKGTTSLQTPKAIRLGMDEVTKLPLFMDVARIIPGGDLFDVSPNAGGLPLPQPITPSHPLFTIGVGMIGNKDLFFGKEIVDSNDTRGEAITKRSEWLWKQVAPALAVGGGHFDRGMNALAQASGGEIEWLPDSIAEKYTGIGKDRLPVQPGLAALQTFGIKVRPLDLQKSAEIEGSKKTKMIRDIASEMRSLARLNGAGALSDAVFEREMEKSRVKIDRLTEGLTVDGEER